MTNDCDYCGCDVTAHDPVYTFADEAGTDRSGQFCNYGCLAAHIEREGLARGTTCSVDL